MRIGVLTFHRCINYGSYWQARCLTESLQARGHNAILLDHHSRAVTSAEWRCALQPTLPERSPVSHQRLYAAKARKFLSAFEELPLSSEFALDNPAEAPRQDVVVVGSDEVWNLHHPWYGGQPAFFGEGLNSDRVVAYAASLGAYDAGCGFDDHRVTLLKQFDAISVRDENSRDAVGCALGSSPPLVLDPCLLSPPLPSGLPTEVRGPYILVYGHGFSDAFQAAVRRAATQSGKRLISVGYVNVWADEQRADAGPAEFAALFEGAAAVATNFFHGCVFAVLNDKPFISVSTPYRFNKLRDLTRLLGAERRLLSEVCELEVADLLEAPLEPIISERIIALRAQSNAYLDQVLA